MLPAVVGMDPAVALIWQAGIAAVVTIVLGFMQYRLQLTIKGAKEEAKRDTDEVKETLEVSTSQTTSKLAQIEKTGKDTHVLVNSNMGIQLNIAAAALRRIADMTNAKGDLAAADLAEQAYKDHMDKQAVVDSEVLTKAPEPKKQSAPAVAAKPQSLGQAVGDMSEDVKVVKEDVKELKSR